ncbi:MAG: UbiA family prenyltransferase [Pseudomonadales bacterium]
MESSILPTAGTPSTTVTVGQRATGQLALIRPFQTVVVAVGTLIGSRLAEVRDPDVTLLMTLSTACLFAASVTYNDLHNMVEDARNRPHRPLIAGTARPALTGMQAWLLFALGIGAALLVGPSLGAAATVVAILSIGYSRRLKNTQGIGNVVVALVSSYTIACWMLVASPTAELITACAILWLIRMGGELIKTAEDAHGDAGAGLVTLATIRGARYTHLLGLSFLSAAVLGIVMLVPASPAPAISMLVGSLCALLVAAGWSAWRSNRRGVRDRRLVFVERAVTGTFMVGLLATTLAAEQIA